MTPKEKAIELVRMFAKKSNNLKQRTDWNYDKQCALIAVDEIINLKLLWFQKDTKELDYWQEVKQEIENI